MRNFLLSLLALFVSLTVSAQENVQMADGLRAEGKIYVVVAVMLVIFISVALYLFSIDKKVKKLEKDK
ncbi:CcmD family protein [Sphingobacterium cellulitidis]|uniref:CcmD family protein n=1 Tax=Sphingobacterium cellulitidis TaxID=1768011 RepID=UPI000B93D515|nr:CcmD family protein [Sphingobacterium cellulitidis]OYD47263.1 CcmD family protein [Sphingobacterium cellulitidis]